jgi:hypothetical protein
VFRPTLSSSGPFGTGLDTCGSRNGSGPSLLSWVVGVRLLLAIPVLFGRRQRRSSPRSSSGRTLARLLHAANLHGLRRQRDPNDAAPSTARVTLPRAAPTFAPPRTPSASSPESPHGFLRPTCPQPPQPFWGVRAAVVVGSDEEACPSGRRRRSLIILASDSLSGSRQSSAQARTRSIVSVRVIALASAIASIRSSSGTENRKLVDTRRSRCSVPSGNSSLRPAASFPSVCERLLRFELIDAPPRSIARTQSSALSRAKL